LRSWKTRSFVDGLEILCGHHLLEGAAELPALIGGIEIVRRDEHAVALRLGGLEQSRQVLDGVVLADALAHQAPGDAVLAQHVVLRIDHDERGVVLVDVHVGLPNGHTQARPGPPSALLRSPPPTEPEGVST
jgi:hypothetical protein